MNDEPDPIFLVKSTQMDEDEVKVDEENKDEDVGSGGSCFVATAAYRDPWHPDVKFLRAFRDNWLVHRAWGRVFIALYWRVGPILARPVRRNDRLAGLSKAMLSGLVRMLRLAFAQFSENWSPTGLLNRVEPQR